MSRRSSPGEQRPKRDVGLRVVQAALIAAVGIVAGLVISLLILWIKS